MENRYGNLYSPGGRVWTSTKNGEFQEEDIWESVINSKNDSDSRVSFHDPSLISKRPQTALKIIPKSNKSNSQEHSEIIPQSAPVSIPDWSKIYGTSSKNTSVYSRVDESDDVSDYGFARSSWESDDEDEDEDGIVIPPHEWIARKLARKQKCSFSVCEGAGRTLKGRDLSRVRNAVLAKTGFLESKKQ